MPPKSKRLQAKDFKEHSKNVLYNTPYFDLRVLFNNKNKFACVVKKNTFEKSVKRNKVRRKMYNILTKNLINQKESFILYPKKQSYNTPHKNLVEEILKIKKELH